LESDKGVISARRKSWKHFYNNLCAIKKMNSQIIAHIVEKEKQKMKLSLISADGFSPAAANWFIS